MLEKLRMLLAVRHRRAGSRQIVSACLATVVPILAPLSAQSAGSSSDSARIARRATAVVEALAANRLEDVAATFTASLRRELPAVVLRQGWLLVESDAGPYVRMLGTDVLPMPTGKAGIVRVQFTKRTVMALMTFVGGDSVAGISLQRESDPAPSPTYIDSAAFSERPIIVGSSPWQLSGTLTIPRKTGPHAAVVLVHGSGPLDRDETVGATKPFQDLAWGLASAGITVLRYDKRTYTYARAMMDKADSMTVEEETVADAVAAAQLLARQPEVDPSRVFIAGHSLGAMLLPRIGLRMPSAAGLIYLAAPARPLEDMLVAQVRYMAALKMDTTNATRTLISDLEVRAKRVKDPSLSPSTLRTQLPMSVPAAYWLDLRGYDGPHAARALQQPMFFAQGGKDYNVTRVDFQRWQDSLRQRPNVTSRYYERLLHSLVETADSVATPEALARPGHVSPELIRDLVGWILGQPRGRR
jgi:dienelactone hydrolase